MSKNQLSGQVDKATGIPIFSTWPTLTGSTDMDETGQKTRYFLAKAAPTLQVEIARFWKEAAGSIFH